MENFQKNSNELNDDDENIKQDGNNSDSWISEDEEIFRLKVDQIFPVKTSLTKINNNKVKRLDKEELKNHQKNINFMISEVFPKISKNDEINGDTNEIIHYGNNRYNFKKLKEVGTALFFEIGKNNLNYVGKNDSFIKLSTKVYQDYKINAIEKKLKEEIVEKKEITKKSRKRIKLNHKDVPNNNLNNNLVNSMNKGELKPELLQKKKKRKKHNYIKNSTIIEIKQIK